MRLKRITIENIRSFRYRQIFEPNRDFTILIGPNGGGKTNLLDILTYVVRRFFIPKWTVTTEFDRNGKIEKFVQTKGLSSQVLAHHIEADTKDTLLEFEWEITRSDIENLAFIRGNRDRLLQEALFFQNGQNGLLPTIEWNPDDYSEGDLIRYEIFNGSQLAPHGPKANRFAEYLQLFEKLSILCSRIGYTIARPFAYFPAMRSSHSGPLRVKLDENSLAEQEKRESESWSRNATSFFELASQHFAQKHRLLEATGQLPNFENEPEVVALRNALTGLGFSIKVQLLSPQSNQYDVLLERDGKPFDLGSASSGERELLHFVFGLCALKVCDGLVIIDEPELHLHPRWQLVLQDLLRGIQLETGNQFVLTTHSPSFVRPPHCRSLQRIARLDGASQIFALDVSKLPDQRHLFEMVNSHNNERMFFADTVVLVEGIHDRLVFETMLRECRGHTATLFQCETTKTITEVVEVCGKHNFARYRSLLDALRIPSIVITDLDYLESLANSPVASLFRQSDNSLRKSLVSPKSLDASAFVAQLERAIESSDWGCLREFLDYVKSRHRKLKERLTFKEKRHLLQTIIKLTEDGIFVLRRGSIDDYLPVGCKSIEETMNLVHRPSFVQEMQVMEHHFRELLAICDEVWKGDTSKKSTDLRTEPS